MAGYRETRVPCSMMKTQGDSILNCLCGSFKWKEEKQAGRKKVLITADASGLKSCCLPSPAPVATKKVLISLSRVQEPSPLVRRGHSEPTAGLEKGNGSY